MLFLMSFYDANKKPAGAGSGVFWAVFGLKLWVVRQLRRVELCYVGVARIIPSISLPNQELLTFYG